MKNIYAGIHNYEHASELFYAIKNSQLSKEHNILFTNEKINQNLLKEYLKTCDYMLAEVSSPTITLGVEMGIASAYGTKIICMHQRGNAVSEHIKKMCSEFIEYSEQEDLIEKLDKIFNTRIESLA